MLHITTKPSDLIAELQGRLPIRVGPTALSVDDFAENFDRAQGVAHYAVQLRWMQTEGETTVQPFVVWQNCMARRDGSS